MSHPTPPMPDGIAGLRALQAMLKQRTVLAALESFHHDLGDVFQIDLPGFKPVVLVGPEANRFVLVSAREKFYWRPENDPVTRLLRHGVLVEDEASHDDLRRLMNPALHKKMMAAYLEIMRYHTDSVLRGWHPARPLDMLVEMRRLALLILFDTLFRVDLTPDMAYLWPTILKLLDYISPGAWIFWRDIPRPRYRRAIQQMDEYLYLLIRRRRQQADPGEDLLGLLVQAGLNDALIRDQLLTMLIAGHDTSTAQLSWSLYLLGRHPDILARVQTELDIVLRGQPPSLEHLGELELLDWVVKETLRMYPPIHLGMRAAAIDFEFGGYQVSAGQRVLYSIYLTHHHPDFWPQPHQFNPYRFAPAERRARAHYTYLPFGGGRRNCIGFAFAEVEAKVVLARILQQFDIQLVKDRVHPHMGATLEPRPGVMMSVRRRA